MAFRDGIEIRPAAPPDMDAINRVIEAAVMTWSLPERVKRLSLATYRYTALDLDHFGIVVAEDRAGEILGVAAWEAADPKDTPEGASGLLLHGLYVSPASHRRGIGGLLLARAQAAARCQGRKGVLVKAQEDAIGFFVAQGMRRLEVQNPSRQYPHRYWKEV
jgi:predicted N-acetyltransferase YhbS